MYSIVSASLVLVALNVLPSTDMTNDVYLTERELNLDPIEVRDTTISFNRTNPDNSESKLLSAEVYLYKNNISETPLARKLGHKILKRYPEFLEQELILVTLIYEYNIGIFSLSCSKEYYFVPEELFNLK